MQILCNIATAISRKAFLCAHKTGIRTPMFIVALSVIPPNQKHIYGGIVKP